MKILTLDFETFFTSECPPGDDRQYRLRRSSNEKAFSTEEYIRHPWFAAHGCALKFGPDLPAKWWDREELPGVFEEIDWDNTFCISHHANFDHLILAHHYNARPRMSGCTLSMARLLLGNHLSVSLDSVRKQYGLSLKTTPYNLFKGKRWPEIDAATRRTIGEGACDEVESIYKIFGLLLKDFSREELSVVDTVIKMFSQPVLRADLGILRELWKQEAIKKQDGLTTLGLTEADLQSADRFAQILRDYGIEPETKDGKKGPIYCFAKTDQFMRDLQEDDDATVRLLAETRLGVKSTILQTRAETLGGMARRGPLPVYLRYAGAGTLRVSGGDGANWLNFKRGSAIRKAILAPEGFVLCPIDSSQIEFRVCNFLAGQEDVIQQLRNGEDPYLPGACEFYREKIYKAKEGDPRYEEMQMKRGMSKQANLMCIYGAAGPKFKATAKAGLYGPPVDMSLEDANRWVKLFRDMHPALCAKNTGYWAQAGRMLARLGGGPEAQWGPLTVKNKRIYLPEGQPLIYDTLEYYKPTPEERHTYGIYAQDGHWRVRTRQGWKELWGSKLVQNVCEAVSRVIVSQAMNRITRMGYRVLNWPYDELLVLIPKDGHEIEHAERCKAEMLKAPSWLAGLPLDAEYIISERYAK